MTAGEPRVGGGSPLDGARKTVLLDTPMLDPVGAELLGKEVEVVNGWELSPEARAEVLARAHGLGGGGTTADVALGHQLEVIASYGSGVDHIDVAAATAAGILVVNAAGSHYTAVAEHGVGLMLAFARRIAYADRVMHTEGRMPPRSAFTGDGWPGWPTELRGRVLGVVGYGFIGRDLAQKCRSAFGMKVLAYAPRFDPDEAERQGTELTATLDDLLARSDYVSLSVPLTPETTGMIGREQLARMKPTAVLVNLSRGGTVDTDALVDALRSGRLAGAALDVFDPEPLPDRHPLYGMDNVVLTPHIGGWADQSGQALSRTVARELLRALRGDRPWRLVNPDAWPHRRGAAP